VSAQFTETFRSPTNIHVVWQVSLLTGAVTNLTGSIRLPDAIALTADQQTLYITAGGGLLVSYTITTGSIANLTSNVFSGAFDDAFGPDPNLVYITDNEKNALFVYQRAQQNLVSINTTFAQSIFFPVAPASPSTTMGPQPTSRTFAQATSWR